MLRLPSFALAARGLHDVSYPQSPSQRILTFVRDPLASPQLTFTPIAITSISSQSRNYHVISVAEGNWSRWRDSNSQPPRSGRGRLPIDITPSKMFRWCGWWDSNPQDSGSRPDTSTKLRHIRMFLQAFHPHARFADTVQSSNI